MSGARTRALGADALDPHLQETALCWCTRAWPVLRNGLCGDQENPWDWPRSSGRARRSAQRWVEPCTPPGLQNTRNPPAVPINATRLHVAA